MTRLIPLLCLNQTRGGFRCSVMCNRLFGFEDFYQEGELCNQ